MKKKRRYNGLRQHIRAHWPPYFLTYGAIMATLLLIGFGLQSQLWSIVPLAMALLLLLAYFFGTSLWAAHQLHDESGLVPHHKLFDMGKIRAGDSFIYIGAGLHDVPTALAQRLTTGQITAVNIYSLQWMPSKPLHRARLQSIQPDPDPRLKWQSGRLNLLPLPNESVQAVILSQTAIELHQRGDQVVLFKEIRRILAENGRFLLAERSRSQTNWVVMGLTAVRLPRADHWRDLLIETGFHLRTAQDLRGLITCYRADKPTRTEARQLRLDL